MGYPSAGGAAVVLDDHDWAAGAHPRRKPPQHDGGVGDTAATGERRKTVGYERERAALRAGLQTAVTGRGLMLCVAGEPGSGKTTLVEDFVEEVIASGRPCHIARGRCSERLAGSGAYLPLLDALEGLVRADARGVVARLLSELAPNWCAQVAPALERPSPQARPPAAVQAASQERLKRELNAFLREVCRLRPLVLFLDDLHWVDPSTIDILGYVANQMSTAQMLIVATCRPAELHLAKHPFGPLKLDLQARGLCREISLDLLTRDDIELFLALEFPGHRFPPAFAQFLHANAAQAARTLANQDRGYLSRYRLRPGPCPVQRTSTPGRVKYRSLRPWMLGPSRRRWPQYAMGVKVGVPGAGRDAARRFR